MKLSVGYDVNKRHPGMPNNNNNNNNNNNKNERKIILKKSFAARHLSHVYRPGLLVETDVRCQWFHAKVRLSATVRELNIDNLIDVLCSAVCSTTTDVAVSGSLWHALPAAEWITGLLLVSFTVASVVTDVTLPLTSIYVIIIT